MAKDDNEEEQLRSVALQNARAILLARQRAEEALRKQSEWLRVTLASIGDGVISTDAEGRVTFMNSVAEFLTDWSQATALGQPLSEVFHIINEHSRQPVENPALRVLREGNVVGLANHTILIAKGGQEWPVDDSAAPIRNEQGEVAGAVLVFRDITERKRAESNTAFLAEISQDLLRLADVSEIMQTLGEKISAYLKLSLCAFLEINEAVDEAVVAHEWRRPDVRGLAGIYRISNFVTVGFQQASRAGETFAVQDTSTDARTDPASFAALGIGAFVSVPLIREGEWRFLLVLADATARIWRNDEIELVRELTARIWTRLERVQAEAALRERNRQLDLLARTSHELIFGGKSDVELLQVVFEAVREEIGMEFFFCYLVNDESQMLQLVASNGLSTKEKNFFAKIHFGEYLCGTVAARAEQVVVENLPECGFLEAATLQEAGMQCYGGFPLIAHERLIGTIAFATRRRTRFRPGELQMIRTVCDLVTATLDRTRLFKELRETKERFAKAFNASPVVLTISSLTTGVLVEVNETFVRTTGFSQEEALGRTTLELGLWKKPDERTAEMDTVRQLGQVRDAEYQFYTKDGRELTGLLSAERIEIGGKDYALTAIRDITEEKRLFAAERKAREQAEVANRLKDSFLATVSHELRTPLNHMLGWVVMLRGGKLPPEKATEALATIERNIRAQNRLVEDLLDVSRIVSGKMQLQIQTIMPAQVIEAAVTSARPAAEAKNLRLEVVLNEPACTVSGDSDRLQQVVWNLLSNAIKFTPNGGHVVVRLDQRDGHIEITVSDTGQGIAPEFLSHVFDRFSQADASSKRKHGGLGLGLAIVRHLVELHGGEASVASPGLGQGASFTIKLPLTSTLGGKGELEQTVESESMTEDAVQLDGLRVLVVDDDADSRLLLMTILSEHSAEVRTAAGMADALRVLDIWPPDVLVSDIGMPDGDGYELIRTIRQREQITGKLLPAVALTAYVRAEDRVQVFRFGYQMHVPKPVEVRELLMVVASLTGRLVEHSKPL
jgi:PAS domain S-box-containing protein